MSQEKINQKPEPNPDLGEYTSEQLIDEITSRFDSSVFAATVDRSDDTVVIHRRYFGNQLECVGMLEHLKKAVLNDFDGSLENAIE